MRQRWGRWVGQGPTSKIVGVVQDVNGHGFESDIGFEPDPYPMSDIGFTTDLRGRFNIIIPEGDYEIIAGDSVENTVREPITIVADETTRVDSRSPSG